MSKTKTSLSLVSTKPTPTTEIPSKNIFFDFQVDRICTEYGVELILLNRETLTPIFWPNVYIVSKYDRSEKSVNTSDSVLRALGSAHLWAWSNSKDFDEELRYGGFFSVEKIASLADFLSYQVKSQRQLALRIKTELCKQGSAQPKSKKMKLIRLKNDSDVINRINWVAKYMKWHLVRRLGELSRNGNNTYELRNHANAVLHELRERGDTKSAQDDETKLEGASNSTLKKINEALELNEPAIHYQSDFLQVRNYLLWRLYVDTGARRGEVHMARVSDIDYSTQRFHICVSKTKARTVPISIEAAEAFDYFIQKHWSKLPLSARKRGFIFTSILGEQITPRQINRIFEEIRSKLTLPEHVTPHTLRRSWNDNFSEVIDSMPDSERPSVEKETQIRNRLQGWSLNSDMGAKYARRHIRRKSDAIAERVTQQIMKDK
ncbi:tyrosine-type recombinase/integrase [Pseudoalteromonas sp. T1lg24]|uniref:tyrosine-type recombinase/integrase n=1 Tax=Pseudoalteromonas sp. T1lg24 TaxID=2077099 RepID=UPI001319E784|nr:tyrosine-type recombinase/integrase [Pseudoalteromonas sp. T1lg24]